MAVTNSLRTRGQELSTTLEQRVREYGGQVSGTITDIRRKLEIGDSNNEVRVAFGLLCDAGRMTGTPLDSISIGMPTKKYLYRTDTDPESVLLMHLRDGRIDRCGTAADYIEILGLNGLTTPLAFDGILQTLKSRGVISAPIAQAPNHANRQSVYVYLYLELAPTA